MMILGMVYDYFTHIIDNTCKRQQTEDCDQLDQPQKLQLSSPEN